MSELSPDEPSIASGRAARAVPVFLPDRRRQGREQIALEILALRSLELADQVASGELPFLETVNTIYDAAVDSGLIVTVGDRIVQATIAAAFANARRPT
jgi:hypothetical protein